MKSLISGFKSRKTLKINPIVFRYLNFTNSSNHDTLCIVVFLSMRIAFHSFRNKVALLRNCKIKELMNRESTDTIFRIATKSDSPSIWAILKYGIELRKSQGSQQWQDGYPNEDTIAQDIEKKQGFVIVQNEQVVAYCALIPNDEPAYENIEGEWLTKGDFLVVHRMGVSSSASGKGFGKMLLLFTQKYALEKGIPSIKVDTNFDNLAMLSILEKLGYTYCGEVFLRGAPRRAYEKVLIPNKTI